MSQLAKLMIYDATMVLVTLVAGTVLVTAVRLLRTEKRIRPIKGWALVVGSLLGILSVNFAWFRLTSAFFADSELMFHPAVAGVCFLVGFCVSVPVTRQLVVAWAERFARE